MEKIKIYLETSIFSFYHEIREYGEYPIFKAQVREGYQGVGIYKPSEVLEL